MKLVLITMGLIFWPIAEFALAQQPELTTMQRGDRADRALRIGQRWVPLPIGTYQFISGETFARTGGSGGTNGRYYLALIQEGRVRGWVHILSNLSKFPGGFTRDKQICDRTDVYYQISDKNYRDTDQACWQVNYTAGDTAVGGKAEGAYLSFLEATAPLGRPSIVPYVGVFGVASADFISIRYYVVPISANVPDENVVWSDSLWNVARIKRDPARSGFQDKMRSFGEVIFPAVMEGLKGNRINSLARSP